MNYEKLCKEFLDYKCQLLTTEIELAQQMKDRDIFLQHAKVKILSACGHEHECVVCNYLQRRTAVMCKDCRWEKIRTMLERNKAEINVNEIEYNGYAAIKIILENHNYQVEKTKEGCRADFMIRLNMDSMKDEWIGVQLKVASRVCYNAYSFRRVDKSYDNLLIFCYCIEPPKLWILPYYNIRHLKYNLNISERSKYNKYLVKKDTDIQAIIKSYQDTYLFYTKDELLLPISLQQRQEQVYARLREKWLPFIDFTYPAIDSGKTDFYIGSLKIQEKVAYSHRHSHIISLTVNNGKINGKRQYRTYCIGENDFYWIHLKDTHDFYVIPEIELYTRGYISEKDKFLSKVNFSINNVEWLKSYLFHYQDMDEMRLRVLLGL